MTRGNINNGKEFCESVTNHLSSLIDMRDFVGAIRYYEANRGFVDDVGGASAGSVLLVASKAYSSLTRYPEALKLARLAQALVAEDGESLVLAEVFVTLGRILLETSEVKEAKKAFQDAESIFRRNDDLEGQCRALNHLAGLLFRQADYRHALGVLMDAVEIARKLDDKKKLAFMMGNIGRLHTFIGDLSEAEKHLVINVELSTELGDELETARACLSLGYVHIQQAAYPGAERALAKAYPLIINQKSRRDEAIYLSYLGELHYRCARCGDSQEALEKALSIAEEMGPQSTLVGRILRHLAELHLRLENHRLARKFTGRAMAIMGKTANKVEIGNLYRIKAQLAEVKNRKDTGIRLFHKAIDLLDESGVRFEKAQVLIAAGCSSLFTPRQRMTYLFRAEEFYARSRITTRHNEVGRLISSLESVPATGISKTWVDDTRVAALDHLTESAEIRRFKTQLPLFGDTDLPILLTGETGVGKDHLARYFHSLVRESAPYVVINCASVPETLLESELFGYSRGAFTGAECSKPGLFVTANRGMLVLDEIGDMPLSLQAKLLGVMERRKLIPLGSTSEVDLDVVLVVTTNKDLEVMVREGAFRRDLYYRLSGIAFHIPPLRERKQDIPLLLKWFLTKHGLLNANSEPPAELVRQFVAYDWPGNIRELENKVRRLEIMAQLVTEGDLVELSHSLFGETQADSVAALEADGSLFDRVGQFECKLITEALLIAHGNKSQAARILGVHEATVRTKLKRYGISFGLPGGAPD